MPRPDQKSVTLPSELVGDVQAAVLAGLGPFKNTTELIRAAVAEKLAQLRAGPAAASGSPSPPPGPMTPAPPPGGQAAASGEAEGGGHESGNRSPEDERPLQEPRKSLGGRGREPSAPSGPSAPAVIPVAPPEAPRLEIDVEVLQEQIRKDKRRGLETAGREALLAREQSRLPSPPSTSAHPADVARGPGDARPAEPVVASSAPQGGRSPRLEPGQGIPPHVPPADESVAHAKPEISPPAATASEPARGVPEISRVAVAKPAARQPDVDRVVRFVKMFLTGAKEATDRRAYIAAAIKEAHRDQGVVISDADALELVGALAAREPAIERALEPPISLDPHISKSTTTPTRKGGARGR